MDKIKLERKRRTALAGSIKVQKLVRDAVNQQIILTEQLAVTHSHSKETAARKSALEKNLNRSPRSAGTSTSLTKRVLNESVLQLALLEVLCHLSEIHEAKENSLRDRLKEQSQEISRLNNRGETYRAIEAEVSITERIASELVEQ